MRTLAEIKANLQHASRQEYEVLARALAADERKGVVAALASAKRRLDAQEAEKQRLQGMYSFQNEMAAGKLAMGLDEVGRGPVAGPLTVAAVVLDGSLRIEGLNDSKQVAPAKREEIAAKVKEQALAWHIEHVPPQFIDEHGMTASLRRAFTASIAAIDEQLAGVEVVLLDGNAMRLDPRETNIIKGDARCAAIAAASIIAKVERDALMDAYAKEFPAYAFDSNKGYASAAHIDAIKECGLSPIHRASFCTAWTQESLF